MLLRRQQSRRPGE